jgi:hypothetical protein
VALGNHWMLSGNPKREELEELTRIQILPAEPDVLAQIIPHLSSLTSKSQAEQYLYVSSLDVGFPGTADEP